MNPLDKEELTEILKIIKNDMPVHTDRTAKIKHTQYKRFPKSLFQESIKIDNKFLNDNLHTIEEMEYRKKGITNNFKNYQNKYYDESGILNHDLYFKHEGTIYPKLHGACGFIIDPYRAVVRNGAELTSGSTTSIPANLTAYIYCSKLSIGIIGQYYDRVAHNVFTAAGNIRMAVYQDNGGSPSIPNTLYQQTSSAATTADFTYRLLTEFALTTSQNWTAFQTDSSTTAIYERNAANMGGYKAQAYGVFTSNGFTVGGDEWNTKVGHS